MNCIKNICCKYIISDMSTKNTPTIDPTQKDSFLKKLETSVDKLEENIKKYYNILVNYVK